VTATPMSRARTFHLVPKADAALDRAAEITGHSRTDVVNRALQAYLFLVEQRQAGADLLVRNGDVVEKFGWDS
jgi:predicted transcriptional regulator